MTSDWSFHSLVGSKMTASFTDLEFKITNQHGVTYHETKILKINSIYNYTKKKLAYGL